MGGADVASGRPRLRSDGGPSPRRPPRRGVACDACRRATGAARGRAGALFLSAVRRAPGLDRRDPRWRAQLGHGRRRDRAGSRGDRELLRRAGAPRQARRSEDRRPRRCAAVAAEGAGANRGAFRAGGEPSSNGRRRSALAGRGDGPARRRSPRAGALIASGSASSDRDRAPFAREPAPHVVEASVDLAASARTSWHGEPRGPVARGPRSGVRLRSRARRGGVRSTSAARRRVEPATCRRCESLQR